MLDSLLMYGFATSYTVKIYVVKAGNQQSLCRHKPSTSKAISQCNNINGFQVDICSYFFCNCTTMMNVSAKCKYGYLINANSKIVTYVNVAR